MKRLCCGTMVCVLFSVISLTATTQVSGDEPVAPKAQPPASQVSDPRGERAVAAGLQWLARHQHADGHWSFDDFSKSCKDDTCTEPGEASAKTLATSLSLLNFLAARQSHKSKGPYRKTIHSALYYITSKQTSGGELAKGEDSPDLAHAVAAFALCEVDARTKDRGVEIVAQAGINRIVASKFITRGIPSIKDQDTAAECLNWQFLAILSAKQAELKLASTTFEDFKRALDELVVKAADSPSPALLAAQLLWHGSAKSAPNSPPVKQLYERLLKDLPNLKQPDLQTGFMLTLALQRLEHPSVAAWRMEMRKNLTATQCKERCAAGSWPAGNDVNANFSGRLFATSLSTLTLEMNYGHLAINVPEPWDDLDFGDE